MVKNVQCSINSSRAVFFVTRAETEEYIKSNQKASVNVLFLDLHNTKGPFSGKSPFLTCKYKNKKVTETFDLTLCIS